MDQQGTSTPEGASAADPMPRAVTAAPAGATAAGAPAMSESPQEMAREIEANIPGTRPPPDWPGTVSDASQKHPAGNASAKRR
jgi:hypothetical protein